MSKASKSSTKAGSSSKSSPIGAVSQLESSCTSSPFNPNPLLPLLALSRHTDAQVVHKAIWALHRVFVRFINENKVGGVNESTRHFDQAHHGVDEDDEEVSPRDEGSVKGWVRDRLFDYVEVLGSLLRDSEPALRVSFTVTFQSVKTNAAELINTASIFPPGSAISFCFKRQARHTYAILSLDPSVTLRSGCIATRRYPGSCRNRI